MRELRIAKELTQPEVARCIPCSRTYITKYENGHLIPTLTVIEKLAAALGVALADLFDESIEVEKLARATAMYGGDDPRMMVAMVGLVCQLDSAGRYLILQAAKGLTAGEAIHWG